MDHPSPKSKLTLDDLPMQYNCRDVTERNCRMSEARNQEKQLFNANYKDSKKQCYSSKYLFEKKISPNTNEPEVIERASKKEHLPEKTNSSATNVPRIDARKSLLITKHLDLSVDNSYSTALFMTIASAGYEKFSSNLQLSATEATLISPGGLTVQNCSCEPRTRLENEIKIQQHLLSVSRGFRVEERDNYKYLIRTKPDVNDGSFLSAASCHVQPELSQSELLDEGMPDVGGSQKSSYLEEHHTPTPTMKIDDVQTKSSANKAINDTERETERDELENEASKKNQDDDSDIDEKTTSQHVTKVYCWVDEATITHSTISEPIEIEMKEKNEKPHSKVRHPKSLKNDQPDVAIETECQEQVEEKEVIEIEWGEKGTEEWNTVSNEEVNLPRYICPSSGAKSRLARTRTWAKSCHHSPMIRQPFI